MFSQGGLSLEQAPPISVVFRFFVTASFFGVLLGLFLLLDNLGMLKFISHAKELFITHILALGVMASFMFGALFQMLPVIAGVTIKTPHLKVIIVHLFLLLGLIFQLHSFLYNSIHFSYLFSAFFLGIGLLYGIFIMLKELMQIKDHSPSSKGMIFSLFSFVITILFGTYLLLTLGGYIDGVFFAKSREIHYSFALFGWITLLIVSVSFQVVEMFYVTPKYPSWMRKYLILMLFLLLLVKSIAILLMIQTEIITALLSMVLVLYSGVTIHRLYYRKRPTSDATVWFWRLAMGLLMGSMLITLCETFMTINLEIKTLSYFLFIGFVLSVVFAMIYKIIPFLTWFHLSNQGYLEAPMMHDVIHPKRAKIQFYIHVSMLLMFILTVFFNMVILKIWAALLLLSSFGWLLYNLIYAMKKYHYTQKHTERFEW